MSEFLKILKLWSTSPWIYLKVVMYLCTRRSWDKVSHPSVLRASVDEAYLGKSRITLAALFCKTCKSCISVILSLSPQMVSAKSKRGLIKALYVATRASKGSRCLIRFNKPIFFDSLSQSMIRCAHSKWDSCEWQHLDTWWYLHTQGFRDQWQA